MKVALLGESFNPESFASRGHEILKPEEHEKADVFLLGDDLVKISGDGKVDISLLKAALKPFLAITNKRFYSFGPTIPKTIDHLRKYYKIKLFTACEVYDGYDEATESFNVHIEAGFDNEDEKTEQEKELQLLFRRRINFNTNRGVEAEHYARVIKSCVVANTNSLLAKYFKRIGYYSSESFGSELESNKPGFGGGRNSELASITAEMNRMGLQTGFLTACALENAIHRTCFNDDLPSIEVLLPSKTKEKLLSRANSDKTASLPQPHPCDSLLGEF